MSKESQEFFKLLKCSNELIKNKKSLFKEYPAKSKKLSQFLIKIEENLHLRQKNKYIELMEIFLTNQINAEDFSFYAEEIPGLFVFLGGMPVDQDPAEAAPHHTPDFYIDESGMLLGVKAFISSPLVLGERALAAAFKQLKVDVDATGAGTFKYTISKCKCR